MQEQKGINQQSNSRTRRLIIVSTVATTLALSVLGTIFYRSRQAASSAYGIAQKQSLEKLHEDARLAQASLLRDKWRGWALEHKALLQRLLHAQASDQATLAAVWKALPEDNNSVKGGISDSDLMPDTDLTAALQKGTPVFSWQLMGKGGVELPNSDEQSQYQKTQEKFDARMQQNFRDLHDIEISSSMSVGSSQLSLWASGRVTRQRIGPKRSSTTINGKKVDVLTLEDGPHQEVLPPYDFLR